tara:strand:+ start:27 stop:1040 length:1014 start_codon:yes stop_codon:yes gene_type:complete
MADTKISALPASTTPLAGTEVLPIVQSGVTAKVSVANLTAGRAVSALSLTTTNDNSVNGLTVGRGAGAVSTNTAVGASALVSNSSGSMDTALGSGALVSNTTGSSNVGAGYQAGYLNQSGNQNTYLGSQAGYSGLGSFNTAIGYQAGYTSTVNNNTFIGYYCGQLTTGTKNTFIGVNGSGYLVTTGEKNTIIGGYQGGTAPISATGSSFVVLSDGDGNIRATYNATGVGFYVQAAPTSKSTTATLTAAEVLAGILNTTGTSYTVTLPLGSDLDTGTGGMATDSAFTWNVINTASGTITVAANTGITSLGTLTIATGVSAAFKIRKTAASTFVLYRVS